MYSAGGASFAQRSEELSKCLLDTAQRFYSTHGLKENAITSLSQMSTSLDTVASELLMFGADVWPEGIEEDEPAPPPQRKASPRSLSAQSLRYAALLVAGVMLGTIAYSPLAQALRPDGFTIKSATLLANKLHPGEDLSVILVSQHREACMVTIDRLFIDTDGRVVSRNRQFGTAQAITAEPITRNVKVAVPRGLPLGRYSYKAIVHVDCENDETAVRQTVMEFELVARDIAKPLVNDLAY